MNERDIHFTVIVKIFFLKILEGINPKSIS